jgi:hypothetical protein
MTLFSGLAGEIEAAIGRDLTVKLLRARGGTTIAVPVSAEGSMLAGIIGVAAAETIISTFGSGRMTLPCADARGMKRRRAEAIRMLRAGASLQEVALACDLHTRTVSNYRSEMEAEAGAGQLKLPL